MSALDTGGPAFPLQTWDPVIHTPKNETGMTLRDYFAGKALSGLYTPVPDDGNPLNWKHDMLARAAYAAADEMMKAR
jgi:hypothetical protein